MEGGVEAEHEYEKRDNELLPEWRFKETGWIRSCRRGQILARDVDVVVAPTSSRCSVAHLITASWVQRRFQQYDTAAIMSRSGDQAGNVPLQAHSDTAQ